MACHSPLQAWQSIEYGGSPIFTKPSMFAGFRSLTLPCQKCIGCRLAKSSEWAVRLIHELQYHKESAFLTLTYAPEHLPDKASLNKSDFPLFMKRYRKSISPQRIRFFQCGEYGEQMGRPHHHAIIFGHDFPDKEIYSVRQGVTLWESPALNALWGKGSVKIGQVTFDSCAYVARYITKKINGPPAKEHYKGRKPEYITMSNRPGIANQFVKEHIKSIYPHDYVIMFKNGKPFKARPPKYYDKIYDSLEIEKFKTLDEIKKARQNNPKLLAYKNSPELQAAQKIADLSKIKILVRNYETGNTDELQDASIRPRQKS
ncbi:MAG: replication initiator protein [Microvirus sp.]|nr:MAG: replication initiator protein [Microvirus sp.]